MNYLEPNRIHHVREYAWIVINAYDLFSYESWTGAALKLELEQRERSQDWRGFRATVAQYADVLKRLRR